MDEYLSLHFEKLVEFFETIADCIPAESRGVCEPVTAIASSPKIRVERKLLALSIEIERAIQAIERLGLLKQEVDDSPRIDHSDMRQPLEELAGLEARQAVAEKDPLRQIARCQRVQIQEFLLEAMDRKDAVPRRLLVIVTRCIEPGAREDSSQSPSDLQDPSRESGFWLN